MGQPTFETLIENGKPVARYGFMRDVDCLERFRFWSANEVPGKIWRPRYHGHAVLKSTVAVVAIRAHHLTGQRLQSATVSVDPALHEYAKSSDIEQRTHVGSLVVQQAIRDYLQGELTTSDEARHNYVAILQDRDLTEHLRQQGVTAL